MSRKLAGIVAVTATCAAVLSLCSTTYAAPQESVTLTSVVTNGTLGEAVNTVASTNFSGVYTAYKIRVNGDLSSNGSGTFSSEALIYVTPPAGPGFTLQPFSNNGFTATVGTVFTNAGGTASTNGPAVDAVFNIPAGGYSAAGTWSFRFCESFDDGSNATVDGIWNSITITLDDQAPIITALTPSGGNYTEMEPNDANTSSIAPFTLNAPQTINHNMVSGMASGETITGLSTGTSTNGLGTSIDFYRISPSTDTLGIYRYQLTIASAVAGHTGTIRGNTQSSPAVTNAPQPGFVNRRVDTALQTSSTAASGGTPARSNVWYGFGKGESILYAVTGSTATTADYVSTLTRTTVTPVAIATGPTIMEGNLTITRQTGNANGLDFIVYDSNLNPIAGHAFESTSTTAGGMTRLYSAGTYYIAVSNINTMNNNGNPADSTTRTSSVMHYPDAVGNSNTTITGAVTNVNLQIVSGANVTTPAAATPKADGYQVVWFTFTVVIADCDTDGTSDITQANYADCNTNGIMDYCDITPELGGSLVDCNTDTTPDICQYGDCNTNLTLDVCDVLAGAFDCNSDTTPDECQLSKGTNNSVSQPPNAVNASFSDPTCSQCTATGRQTMADNFTLSYASTINSLKVWGVYFNGNVPYATDDFTVIIHASAGTIPGAAINTQTSVPSSRINTGVVLFGVNRYEFTLNITPINLPAGSYWIEVFNAGVDAATNNTWGWETGPQDLNHGGLNAAFATDAVPGVTWTATATNLSMLMNITNTANDCNSNNTPDECDGGDCNSNGIMDLCESLNDCNSNSTQDICEMVDCNTNGTLDECDIGGGADDCNSNGIPDICGLIDCNTNGKLDSCDTAGSTSEDCDTDNTPDECQLNQNMVMSASSTDVPKLIPDSPGAAVESNLTTGGAGVIVDVNVGLTIRHTFDSDLDIALTRPATTVFLASANGAGGDNFTGTVFDDEAGTSVSAGTAPFTGTFIPVQALSAFDGQLKAGTWKLTAQDFFAADTGTILSWQLELTVAIVNDCDTNGTPDQCDFDANSNGRPDICEDCNTNSTPDSNEPGFQDCDTNDTADFCDIGFGTSTDCNTDGTIDLCQYGDCNTNDILDVCEALTDCDTNNTPDICELVDCNTNNILDICDIPPSGDCNTDGVPDECQLTGNSVDVINTPIPIQDGITNSNTFNSASPGFIQDVDVDLTVQHTWDSDVDVTLVHNGLTITLTDANGGSGDNYTGTIFDDAAATSITAGAAPFSNTFKPETPLAGYNGMNRLGAWVLIVFDGAGGDTGTVLQWSLHILASGGDCDTNGTPDDCDIDANSNGTVDACEDCNTNGSTDNTEPGYQDCNSNLTADFCEIGLGSTADCNTNDTIDLCEISMGTSVDCNTNDRLDICELDLDNAADCNTNDTLDVCEGGCNTNGVPDVCELAGNDCNTNDTLDVCELVDCNTNTTLDICEITGLNDCNTNNTPDECDLSGGVGMPVVTQLPNAVNGSFSDPTCSQCTATGSQAMAENFTLSTGQTIKSINVWGGYFPGNVAYTTDNFTVAIHASAGVVPGAVISSQSNVPSSRINTGFVLFGVNRYAYTLILSSPVTLPAGSYWVSVFNSAAGSDTWFWETGNQDLTNGGVNAAFSTSVPGVAWTATATNLAMIINVGDLSNDCNSNGTPDECDLDANSNGVPDVCEDCNTNGTQDVNEPGYADCNTNDTADFCEAPDCNADGTLDVCQFADCNTNGTHDPCDAGYVDCNTNDTSDECEVIGDVFVTNTPNMAIADGATNSDIITLPPGLVIDVDVGLSLTHTWDSDVDITLVHNGVTVTLSDDNGGSGDNYTGTVFDQAAGTLITAGVVPFTGTFRPETSLNVYNGMQRAGAWTLRVGDDTGGDTGTLLTWRLEVRVLVADCNSNGTPDACEAPDCNSNGIPDECEPFADCDSDGTNDICQVNDCNTNGTLDTCEALADCDTDNTPDVCEAGYTDCNTNDTMDSCETPDCNTNGLPDECDLTATGSMSMSSADTPLLIPDNDPLGVISDIAVAGAGTVTDVDVGLSIRHTWDSDLYMVVFNDATTNFAFLSIFNGGSGDNYTGTVFDDEAGTSIIGQAAPFTGTFQPEDPLSIFDGQPKAALWSLYVEDTVGGDTGTILTWTLNFTVAIDHDANTNGTPDECEAPACATCTGDINGDNFVDGQDIAGWVRCQFGTPQGGDDCDCSTGMTTAQFINKLLTDPNTACP